MELSAQDEVRLKIFRAAKPNTWIALNQEETEVVGQGATITEAWEQARMNGFADPIVWRVPPDWRPRFLCRA